VSLRRWRKRVRKRVRKAVKRVGRKAAKVAVRVHRVMDPLVTGALGFFFGVPGAAVGTTLSYVGNRYVGAMAMRGEGLRGREARDEARDIARRTATYSAIAGGVGTLTAGVVGGWGAAATGTLGQSWTGLGTGQGMFGLTNPFMTVTKAGAVETVASGAAVAATAAATEKAVGAISGPPKAPAQESWWDKLSNLFGGGETAPAGEGGAGGPGGPGGQVLDAPELAPETNVRQALVWGLGGAAVAVTVTLLVRRAA
jgi:hypothetical protein